MRNFESKRNWGTFFLYAFGFVLLWEWIRPLEKLTDTGHLNIFVVYILLSFLLAFFQTKVWISFPVKVFYIMNCLYVLYYKNGFFSSKWLSLLMNDIKQSSAYVWNGEFVELSSVFRTILFFLLLWLMTYLIHYWLINRKRIFLFFVVTLIYITVLDTFTPYSSKGAIIRAIVTGFAAMGILTLNRILTKEKIGRDFSFSKKWLTALAGLIVISVSVGLIAPKAEPIWPDPVPFIKSLNDKSEGGTQRIGYGVDDSNLGGPFIGDNRVVFRAESKTKHYWRVETKDVYTGKGWIASDEMQKSTFLPEENVPIYAFEGDVEAREETATIYSVMRYPHVIYPFGVQQIHSANTTAFEYDPITEKIYFKNPGANKLGNYSFTYKVPNYSVTKLMQIKSGEQARLNPEFLARYTEIPNNLPPEVKNLAIEITKGKDNWFDKARAIESYFHRSIFTYDQQNVAVPGPKDDYVSQFLFDTKRGYCDNFSTSMAVLLRSIGIPARWVKGYTNGEYKNLGENDTKVYEITNNNAHSWVEVYFPGSGWLAFEPTPGFSNNVTLNFDNYKDTPKNEERTPLPVKKPEPKTPDRLKDDESKKSDSTFSIKQIWMKIKEFLNHEFKWFVLGAIVFGFLFTMIYYKRARWMPHFLIFLYKFKKKDENFHAAYHALLRQLEWYGLKRKQDQTLRDYAKYVDRFFSTNAMTRLTDKYELLTYKGSIQNGTWMDLKELWENLIKKTIA